MMASHRNRFTTVALVAIVGSCIASFSSSFSPYLREMVVRSAVAQTGTSSSACGYTGGHVAVIEASKGTNASYELPKLLQLVLPVQYTCGGKLYDTRPKGEPYRFGVSFSNDGKSLKARVLEVVATKALSGQFSLPAEEGRCVDVPKFQACYETSLRAFETTVVNGKTFPKSDVGLFNELLNPSIEMPRSIFDGLRSCLAGAFAKDKCGVTPPNQCPMTDVASGTSKAMVVCSSPEVRATCGLSLVNGVQASPEAYCRRLQDRLNQERSMNAAPDCSVLCKVKDSQYPPPSPAAGGCPCGQEYRPFVGCDPGPGVDCPPRGPVCKACPPTNTGSSLNCWCGEMPGPECAAPGPCPNICKSCPSDSNATLCECPPCQGIKSNWRPTPGCRPRGPSDPACRPCLAPVAQR